MWSNRSTFFVLAFMAMQTACSPYSELERFQDWVESQYGGGGEDAITIHLPFSAGYASRCVQGAGGSYSHSYTTTRYDIDLDTPNDVDDPVFAPVAGVAYVHDTDRDNNFGVHVNVDLGDGTYIVLAHLDDVFVDDASEVAAGQLLGFEGWTGASTGDHVHLGRHQGSAAQDAIYGTSVEGLVLSAVDETEGEMVTMSTSDMVCDLTTGHLYESLLPVNLWHPNGTLVKTPSNSAVYLLESGTARPFVTEGAFLSRNYDFNDVALVTDEELACYGAGTGIGDDTALSAAYSGGRVWLLMGYATDSDRYRLQVPSVGWQAVLKSYGLIAVTYDDLLSGDEVESVMDDYPLSGETATFRDGTLVSRVEDSAVYFMTDGVAMPIETWDTYLLLGFWNRQVIEVDSDEFDAVVGTAGDCTSDIYCLGHDDATQCGGPTGEYSSAGSYDETTNQTSTDDDDCDDTGEDTEMGTPPTDDLTITWQTPGSASASRIDFAGEYVEDGVSRGWQEYGRTSGTSITATVDSADSGDSFRFSVQFIVDGVTSWSCLSPFPPGTVQGTVSGSFRGRALTITPADDPTSDGCGLQTILP